MTCEHQTVHSAFVCDGCGMERGTDLPQVFDAMVAAPPPEPRDIVFLEFASSTEELQRRVQKASQLAELGRVVEAAEVLLAPGLMTSLPAFYDLRKLNEAHRELMEAREQLAEEGRPPEDEQELFERLHALVDGLPTAPSPIRAAVRSVMGFGHKPRDPEPAMMTGGEVAGSWKPLREVIAANDRADRIGEQLEALKTDYAALRLELKDTEARLEALTEAEKTRLAATWDSDKPLPEDDAIRAAHPLRSNDYARYVEATRLVGAKHSKYALVDLVNWLLSLRP